MVAICINILAIIICSAGALFSDDKGKLYFYLILVIFNSGLLGYNICRAIYNVGY